MEEKKTPVDETAKGEPAVKTETTPEATAEEKKPGSGEGEEKKHKETKRELAALREKVSEIEKTLSEEKEKYLRMLAEYDNFRKRSQKEREGIYTDAVSDVVGQILPIADNLERAGMYSDGEKVAEGLRLTMNALNACLSKLGVTAFGVPGDKFDPNLHNAIMHEEDESKGDGEIVEVFQPGYKRGDKIIRYAMVKVAN
ncbi:MAG: nucleotide exchange factor GrpE [Clostridia bacterium]|nr:nucleotide exchange factor GrpE [Clostridia bacterium]